MKMLSSNSFNPFSKNVQEEKKVEESEKSLEIESEHSKVKEPKQESEKSLEMESEQSLAIESDSH